MRADAHRYLSGALSEARQAALCDHLERCEKCAASVYQAARVITLLRDLPPAVPSSDLAGRIKAAARLEVARARPAPAPRRQPARSGLLRGLAAATVIAGLCTAVLLPRVGSGPRAPLTEAPSAPSLSLAAPSAQEDPSERVGAGPDLRAATEMRAGAAVPADARMPEQEPTHEGLAGIQRSGNATSGRPVVYAGSRVVRASGSEVPAIASLRSPALRVTAPVVGAQAGLGPSGRAPRPSAPAVSGGSRSGTGAVSTSSGSSRPSPAPAAVAAVASGDSPEPVAYPVYAEVAGGLAAAALLTRYVEQSIVSGNGAVVSLAVSTPATRGPEAVEEWGAEVSGR